MVCSVVEKGPAAVIPPGVTFADVYCGPILFHMGSAADTNVVDARLKVHGIAGLRIADASIFPSLPSGTVIGAFPIRDPSTILSQTLIRT